MKRIKLLVGAVLCSVLMFSPQLMAQTQKKPASKSQSVKPVPTKPKSIVPSLASDQQEKKEGVWSEWMKPAAKLEFYKLPYAFDALEPSIDKMTVEIHYERHHRGYYDKMLKAIEGSDVGEMNIFEIFANMNKFPDAVRNNAGGFFNHALYWDNMSPKEQKPSGQMMELINKHFDNFETFQKKFDQAAASRFGSGWAWLSVDVKSGELFISSTPNQDNPMMNTSERRGVPLLALDVWEHAYYLKYQNKRTDYIDSFWKIVNWSVVEARYSQYRSMMEKMK